MAWSKNQTVARSMVEAYEAGKELAMAAPIIREYRQSDADQINHLAVEAFEQFQHAYADWPGFRAKIASMSSLAATGEIIVAEIANQIAGAVAYVGPHLPKAGFFQPEWPIMRMLVVAPAFRGKGVGKILAQECLQRAKLDGATVFALHTSEVMEVALPMYLRMGFRWFSSAPDIHGVKYSIYLKNIAD